MAQTINEVPTRRGDRGQRRFLLFLFLSSFNLSLKIRLVVRLLQRLTFSHDHFFLENSFSQLYVFFLFAYSSLRLLIAYSSRGRTITDTRDWQCTSIYIL